MARPCKRRRICAMPVTARFGPLDGKARATVLMTLDEYESIRLIDLCALTQEQCAESMGIARSTVQAIYDSARRKLAEALTGSGELVISGGDYFICGGSENQLCPHRCGERCRRHGNQNHGGNLE